MTTRRDLLKMAGLAGAVAIAPKDASMPEEESTTSFTFSSVPIGSPSAERVIMYCSYCSTGEFADDSGRPEDFKTVSTGPRYKSGWKRPKRDA